MAASADVVIKTTQNEISERIENLISTELPAELQPAARELLRAVVIKVAVAEHFDAFCGQAFSKPDWAGAASPVIAEMFEQDEDLLAELARIPDLVIEMGAGQVSVTCMVASRWAARGETHRLSRLADSMVASHASKNACTVDVMLALAATLAVTRLSRAEQLFNAALPLAGDEHQDAITDAKHWLAAGRIVCSSIQEERDFWDIRLRKPKTTWTWQSKQERHALESLSERLSPSIEGEDLFKAVLPDCWWDLVVKLQQQRETAELAAKSAAEARHVPLPATAHSADAVPIEASKGRASMDYYPLPRAGMFSRFVLGWVCGAMAMAITVMLLPSAAVDRVLATFRSGEKAHQEHQLPVKSLVYASNVSKTPEEKEAWRKEQLAKTVEQMTPFAAHHAAAKTGTWRENEMVLSGHSPDMHYDSTEYMKMLVWLHLDPPQNQEVRIHVSKLLLERVKTGAITLWEELIYPGSPNADEIRSVASEALDQPSLQLSTEDKERLRALAKPLEDTDTKAVSGK